MTGCELVDQLYFKHKLTICCIRCGALLHGLTYFFTQRIYKLTARHIVTGCELVDWIVVKLNK